MIQIKLGIFIVDLLERICFDFLQQMIQQKESKPALKYPPRNQSIFQSKQNYVYRIVSRSCHMALKPEIRQVQLPEDELKIIGGIQDEKSIKQLWLIKTIKDNKVQIVNFATDLVIESENGDVKLEKGKQKHSQRFQIEYLKGKVNLNATSEIRIKDNNTFNLILDGILDIAKPDDSDQNQIFYLKRVDVFDYKQFQQTFVINNPETKKCLDVTGGDESIGTLICLFPLNMRSNQRWIFEPPITPESSEEVKYSIICMHSGLRLWYDKHNNLIQTDDIERIWTFKKKHGMSGQLYCTHNKKFVNRVEQDKLVMKGNSNGTKWTVI